MNFKLYKKLLSTILTLLAGLEGKSVSGDESVRLRQLILNLANQNLKTQKEIKEIADGMENYRDELTSGVYPYFVKLRELAGKDDL